MEALGPNIKKPEAQSHCILNFKHFLNFVDNGNMGLSKLDMTCQGEMVSSVNNIQQTLPYLLQNSSGRPNLCFSKARFSLLCGLNRSSSL